MRTATPEQSQTWTKTQQLSTNIDISRSGSPKATFVGNKPRFNSVHFVDLYDHINTMVNNNKSAHLVNENEGHIT